MRFRSVEAKLIDLLIKSPTILPVNNNFGECYLSCFLDGRTSGSAVIFDGIPSQVFDRDYEPLQKLYLRNSYEDENNKPNLLNDIQIAIEMGCQVKDIQLLSPGVLNLQ